MLHFIENCTERKHLNTSFERCIWLDVWRLVHQSWHLELDLSVNFTFVDICTGDLAATRQLFDGTGFQDALYPMRLPHLLDNCYTTRKNFGVKSFLRVVAAPFVMRKFR